MKKLVLFLSVILTVSCQQELEPNVENINSIFDTQDFQIRFTLANGDEYRMGFLNNEMAFFSPKETIRRELSYEDARLINTFVASATLSYLETVKKSNDKNATAERSRSQSNRIEIYNDSKKVVFETPDYDADFEELLTQLKLPYVSTEKK
ncbi:hypothetical protein AAU57_03080 [Nonlabens sp. YIK11]|uniref:hypothetical protein n=1 Tax=Nonlabens sp. YIK11 TaxID=1453349 RepID=UPI0006DC7E9B|nr:hypothetical protein [Nonlabens sp. YIK11]KQC32423.1 hypothetical protein AAU57_03080 [Nonlabens sp. YIK11]